MIEYWHWHTLPYGTETYWGGVLPHSLEPGRVYHEVAGLGARARGDRRRRSTASSPTRTSRSSGRTTAGSRSSSSRRSRPPTGAPTARRTSASSTLPPRGRRRRRAGADPARVQARDLGAAELAARFPVLVAAGAVRRSRRRPRPAARLRRRRRAPRGRHPHRLRRRGGARPGRGRTGAAARGRGRAGTRSSRTCAHDVAGHRRSEPLAASDGATAPRLGGRAASPTAPTSLADVPSIRASRDFPAVTTNAPRRRAHHRRRHACRRPALAADLVRWAVPDARRRRARRRSRAPVTVSSGTLPDGRRAWFVFNWSWEPQAITLARSRRRPRHRETAHAAGTDVSLAGLVDADLRRRVSTEGSSIRSQPEERVDHEEGTQEQHWRW